MPRRGRRWRTFAARRVGEGQTELAGLGDLVGGEHHQGLVARRLHLVAQGGLAGAVAGDGRVLAEGDDERGDAGAEPLVEILGLGARLLDRVMQQAGGHDVLGRAHIGQQRRHLDGVQHERRAVRGPLLPGVLLDGVGKRGQRLVMTRSHKWDVANTTHSERILEQVGNCR